MGTERRLPVSDTEVLAAYRAGESQRALAQRFKVSKGAVQKAIARAEGRRSPEPSPTPSAPPGSTRAHGSRPIGTLNIRERLEHEALNSTDSRSRIAALRELARMDAEPAKQANANATDFYFARGSVLLEPRPGGKVRMWVRTPGGWEDLCDKWVTAPQAIAMLAALVLERERKQPEPADVSASR